MEQIESPYTYVTDIQLGPHVGPLTAGAGAVSELWPVFGTLSPNWIALFSLNMPRLVDIHWRPSLLRGKTGEVQEGGSRRRGGT